MNNHLKVSIVIPAYNAEKFIEDCLKSISAQTYRNLEVIVVDDCSKDNTKKIAQKYATVISNETNKGEGGSRNAGAKVTTGDIIVFTDADVVVPKDWIERFLFIMNEKGVKAVSGGYSGSVGDSFIEQFALFELQKRRQSLGNTVSTAVTNNFACKREVYFECGGFPEKYKCEDMSFTYRLSKKTTIYWCNENGVLHNFRKTLKGYLKQQYYFAKDSVIVYYEMPDMLLKRTHQGRSLYIEILLTLVAVLMLLYDPLISFFLLVVVLIINIPLLRLLKKNNMSVLKGISVILLRNISAILGFVIGATKCLMDLTKIKKLRT